MFTFLLLTLPSRLLARTDTTSAHSNFHPKAPTFLVTIWECQPDSRYSGFWVCYHPHWCKSCPGRPTCVPAKRETWSQLLQSHNQLTKQTRKLPHNVYVEWSPAKGQNWRVSSCNMQQDNRSQWMQIHESVTSRFSSNDPMPWMWPKAGNAFGRTCLPRLFARPWQTIGMPVAQLSTLQEFRSAVAATAPNGVELLPGTLPTKLRWKLRWKCRKSCCFGENACLGLAQGGHANHAWLLFAKPMQVHRSFWWAKSLAAIISKKIVTHSARLATGFPNLTQDKQSAKLIGPR